MAETQYQVTQRTPEIEAYELGLLEAGQKLTDKALFDPRFQTPGYQIAQLSPFEQQAASMAQQGVGSYMPLLQQGASNLGASGQFIGDAAVPTMAQGQQYAQEAGRLAQQLREIPYKYQTAAGEGFLSSTGTFDPSGGQAVPSLASRQAAFRQQNPNPLRAAGMTQGEMDQADAFNARMDADPEFAASQLGNFSQPSQQMAQLTRQGQGLTPGSPEDMALRQQYQQLEQSQMQSPVDRFMNPYTERVIDIAQDDIDEQAAAQRQQLDANAVSSGAFGGSRSGLMATRSARNMERERARIGSQLRASGYESARNAAQTAFENTQNRRQAASQGIGNLGLQYGQLSQGDIDQMRGIGTDLQGIATGYGNLAQQGANIGVQQGALAEATQSMLGRDIAQLGGIGGLQRGIQQAGLDAKRMTQTDARNQPFQTLAFMGDMIRGVPSGQQTMTSSSGGGGSASPFQQLIGLGGAAYAGSRAMQGLGSIMP